MRLLLALFSLLLLLSNCQNAGTGSGSAEQAELPPLDTSAYLDRGELIAMKTFDTLSTALKRQIAEAGFARAIDYCRLEAYPITAAYAEAGIQIRRVSAQYRNAKNRPDSLEEIQLATLQGQIDRGESPQPGVVRLPDGSVHYFKPILLQPLCLNCHGQPGEHIAEETLTAIRTAYPQDLATGYAAGQLRGAWHVVFPPESE